jgi:hypothetical protein
MRRDSGSRRRVPALTILVTTSLLVAPAWARAQPAPVQVVGAVRDLSDAPVAGVTVALSGQVAATTTTDADGRFAFYGLPPGGPYTVTPAQVGFTFAPTRHTLTALTGDQTIQAFVVTRGLFTRYFAEGSTGGFFTTEIALLNPTDTPADTQVTFQTPGGTEVTVPLVLEPGSHHTIDVGAVPGLAATAVATVLTSTQPVVADRTMRWDRRGYGSHTETSVAAPRTQWYLAEGATLGDFQCFYLLQNPGATAATVSVTYLRPAPAPPLVKTYVVGPRSRSNIWVNLEEFPTANGPERVLASAEFAASIAADVPIIVERAMYLTRAGRMFEAGHESAASPELAPAWFLAEGATGAFFDLFVLLVNPGLDAAPVEVRYLLPAETFTRTYTVPAQSRVTLWVDQEDPRLADTAVSVVVTSTTGVPLLVERAMWWPGDARTWAEGHASRGATTTGETWALADGQVGGPLATQTYVLVANTSPHEGRVAVTAMVDGGVPVTRTYALSPSSRFTVPMGLEFPETADRRFGVMVESLPTAAGTAQLVVERATYDTPMIDGRPVSWAAGAAAGGTRLRQAEDRPVWTARVLLPRATKLLGAAGPVTAVPETARAVTAEVGPPGGTVSATASDGVTYALTVPRGALRTTTAITLTPVTALTGGAPPLALAAAVHGAPEGVRFAVPATLVVTWPQPLNGAVVGLIVPEGGVGLEVVPVARGRTTATVPVEHFSTVAIPRVTAELVALLPPGAPQTTIAQLAQAAVASGTQADLQALLDQMIAWYDVRIEAQVLTAADVTATDAVRLAWLAELHTWDSWRGAVETIFGHVTVGGAPVRGRLTARAVDGRQGAVAVLGHGYGQWNTACQAGAGSALAARLALAARAARYALLTDVYLEWLQTNQANPADVDQATAPDRDAFGIGIAQIPGSFCLLETIAVAEPAVPPQGTGQLRVTAGTVFGAEAPAYGDVMAITFQPDPASYAGLQQAATNVAGEAFFPVTADANGAIRYRVCVSYRPPTEAASWVTLLYRVTGADCRASVTAVVVSPAQTTLAPGGSQQFTVAVQGTANQVVAWTVDGGGRITTAGLFTSNGATGTYHVQATSAEDPLAVGIAQVTVGTPPPPPPGDRPCQGGCRFSGTWTFCYSDGSCVSWASGGTSGWFGDPWVSTPSATPGVGKLWWFCQGVVSGKVEINLALQQAGAFTGASPSSYTCQHFQSATGTVTGQSLQMSLPGPYTFTGARVP